MLYMNNATVMTMNLFNRQISLLMGRIFFSIGLFLLVQFPFHSQTTLETAFLTEMNAYRKTKQLQPGVNNTKVALVAASHCRYLVRCAGLNHSVHKDKNPHDEDFDIPDHLERTFEQRAAMQPSCSIFGEISYPIFYADNSLTIQQIARNIVEGFSRSPGHNEIMLTEIDKPVTLLVGVSILPCKSDLEGYKMYSVNVNFGFVSPNETN